MNYDIFDEEYSPFTNQDGERSLKDISNQWINLVFKSLENLERYEKLMREGCKDLLDYVQLTKIQLLDAQIKNVSFMISEISILLENVKPILEKKDYIQMSVSLKNIRKEYPDSYEIIIDEMFKTKIPMFKPNFYKLQESLSRLRSQIVSSLSKILYIQEEKIEQMEV